MNNIRIYHSQEPGSARSSPRSSDTNTPASNKVLVLGPFYFHLPVQFSILVIVLYLSSSSNINNDSCSLLSFLTQLHALIEYETSHQADRAVSQFRIQACNETAPKFLKPVSVCSIVHQVDKLNDERNWRKGLRVRPVLRRSVTRTPHSIFIGFFTRPYSPSPISELADHWPDMPAAGIPRA